MGDGVARVRLDKHFCRRESEFGDTNFRSSFRPTHANRKWQTHKVGTVMAWVGRVGRPSCRPGMATIFVPRQKWQIQNHYGWHDLTRVARAEKHCFVIARPSSMSPSFAPKHRGSSPTSRRSSYPTWHANHFGSAIFAMAQSG